MYEFQYHRPASAGDASKAVRDADDGKLLAGGMTLLPTMKMRLARPSDLVDLASVDELKGIRKEGDQVLIGAMTTHAEVASSAAVRDAIGALAHLASGIGDAQVRNRGTLGGSIANNDPAADYPAGLVGLGATVHTDRRTISADDFFTGMFETALEDDEVVTQVSFPVPKRAGYRKMPNPASRYPIVGVMVAETAGGMRVAVTGAAGSVFRVPEMEAALAGSFSAGALEGIHIAADDFNEDLHASAEYRAHLVGVMAKRAVAAAG